MAAAFSFVYYEAARAEYADVVINEFSDEAGPSHHGGSVRRPAC